MNPRIENKEAFTVLGMGRDFSMARCFEDIPAYWKEFFEKGYGETVNGVYGISVGKDNDDSSIRYYIADPCAPEAKAPKGFEKFTVPALTWAVFEGQGKMPEALQALNRHLYQEWLPTNGVYAFGAPYNVEMYSNGDMDSETYRFEIWQAVRKGK